MFSLIQLLVTPSASLFLPIFAVKCLVVAWIRALAFARAPTRSSFHLLPLGGSLPILLHSAQAILPQFSLTRIHGFYFDVSIASSRYLNLFE